MNESEKQFSFTRAALSTAGRAKTKFLSLLSVSSFVIVFVVTVIEGTSLLFAQPNDLYSPLVEAVGRIVSPGASGPVFGLSPAWRTIVAGDDDTSFPNAFVLAREYGLGRVVVVGHDGLLSDAAVPMFDNGLFLSNVVRWLDVKGLRRVGYSTGHGEWATSFGALQAMMAPQGYEFLTLPAPLAAGALANCSVLVVGDGWTAFTTNEIEAVRQFVAGGGGLCMSGLGWSWEPYHPGKTMEDYPMIQLAVPFEVRWLRPVISDPTDQTNGCPIFHRFYPVASSGSITEAMDIIFDAHSHFGTNLPARLESDAALRQSFLNAHLTLAIPASELPPQDVSRSNVFSFYLDLMRQQPQAYARRTPINKSLFPTSTQARERVWRSLRDLSPMTGTVKARIASAGALSGRRYDIFQEFEVVLFDNVTLSERQLDVIYRLLSMIPRDLHTLKAISVYEFLADSPDYWYLSRLLAGQNYMVNIFGVEIGVVPENSFPDDIAPGITDIFLAVLSHEVNHVVDVSTVGWSVASTNLAGRRAQLIAQAGTNHMNYLRSMIPDGFFADAPQEFFASIANSWFTDSTKTLELGVGRFGVGLGEPMNQALYFADVYSRGSNSTLFYFADTNGSLQSLTVPLTRDEYGHVNSLGVGPCTYSFSLDTNGNVLSLTTTGTAQQSVWVWPAPIQVPEGEFGFCLVQLTQAPATNVMVTTTWTSGDTGFVLHAGAQLWFDSTNWNLPQMVWIGCAEDNELSSKSAVFTVSAPGIGSQIIPVQNIDNKFPSIPLAPAKVGAFFGFKYFRDKAWNGIHYVPEVSRDLFTWYPGDEFTTAVSTNDLGQAESVLILDRTSLDLATNSFFRLRLAR